MAKELILISHGKLAEEAKKRHRVDHGTSR